MPIGNIRPADPDGNDEITAERIAREHLRYSLGFLGAHDAAVRLDEILLAGGTLSRTWTLVALIAEEAADASVLRKREIDHYGKIEDQLKAQVAHEKERDSDKATIVRLREEIWALVLDHLEETAKLPGLSRPQIAIIEQTRKRIASGDLIIKEGEQNGS